MRRQKPAGPARRRAGRCRTAASSASSRTWMTVAPPLVAGGEAPVVEQGEQLDGRRLRCAIVGRGAHRSAESAKLARRPRRQVLRRVANRPAASPCCSELRTSSRIERESAFGGSDMLGDATSQRTRPPSTETARPNLSVQVRRLARRSRSGDGEDEGAAVGVAAAAGVPVAGRPRGRSAGPPCARLRSVASMACFSEQIRPICTSPLSRGRRPAGAAWPCR